MRDLSILYGSLKTGLYSVFVQFKRADTVEAAVFDVPSLILVYFSECECRSDSQRAGDRNERADQAYENCRGKSEKGLGGFRSQSIPRTAECQ